MYMYKLPYAYTYALSDLRRIILILMQAMHILLQATIFIQAFIFIQAIKRWLRLMIQVHMQQSGRHTGRVMGT
jgi:hypothetical protein